MHSEDQFDPSEVFPNYIKLINVAVIYIVRFRQAEFNNLIFYFMFYLIRGPDADFKVSVLTVKCFLSYKYTVYILHSQNGYLQLKRRLSQRWYFMKVSKSSNYNTLLFKRKILWKLLFFLAQKCSKTFPKENASRNLLHFLPKNDQTIIRCFSKGKMCEETFYIFCQKMIKL